MSLSMVKLMRRGPMMQKLSRIKPTFKTDWPRKRQISSSNRHKGKRSFSMHILAEKLTSRAVN